MDAACNVDGYFCPGGNVNATQFSTSDAHTSGCVRAQYRCRQLTGAGSWCLLLIRLVCPAGYYCPAGTTSGTANRTWTRAPQAPCSGLLTASLWSPFRRVQRGGLLLPGRLWIQHAVSYVLTPDLRTDSRLSLSYSASVRIGANAFVRTIGGERLLSVQRLPCRQRVRRRPLLSVRRRVCLKIQPHRPNTNRVH